MNKNKRKLKIQAGGNIDLTKFIYIKRPEDEILYRLLNDEEYCNILTSRQMGKSSLMVSTMERLLRDGTRVSSIDIAGDIGDVENQDDWYCAILQHIGNDLELSIDIEDWWRKCQAITRNQKLSEFFLQEILPQVEKKVVIFLDEIDSTLKLSYTDDFFVAIRSMLNKRSINPAFKKVVFCLIGVALPNELIKDQRTTPYNVGTTIDLRDFDIEKDDLNLLYQALTEDVSRGKQIVRSILEWTNGHPYLTLSLCKKFKEEDNYSKPDDVDSLIVTAFSNIEVARQDVHFQYIESFLDTRTKHGFATFKLYEKILNGVREKDESTEIHNTLKLSGLVKRDREGYLIVRNKIYKKVFNQNWVKSTKPQKTVKYLTRFAIAASILIISLFSWFAYDRVVLEPPRKVALELENEFRAAVDKEVAKKIFRLLSGEEVHPDLGKPLKGYEENANELLDTFWIKVEKIAAKDWMTALDNTAVESDAIKYFDILTGELKDPNLNRFLKGFKEDALKAYRNFWDRRSKMLLNSALNKIDNDEIDEGLILGVLAALKQDGEIHPKIVEEYKRYSYYCLQSTLLAKDKLGIINFSPNGNQVIATSDDGTALIWDVKSGKQLLQLGENITSDFGDVAFSPKNNLIATTSGNETLRIWDANSGKQLLELTDHHVSNDSAMIAFSPDGTLITTTPNDEIVRIWFTKSGEESLQLIGHKDVIYGVTFSPDGNLIATTSRDETLRIWDANSGKQLLVLTDHHIKDGFAFVAFSPDSKLVTASPNDTVVRIWNTKTGKEFLQLIGHEDEIFVIAFSPDGDLIATTSQDETLRIWDANSGKQLLKLKSYKNESRGVTFSPDSKLIATTCADNRARIWNLTVIKSVQKPKQILEGTLEEIWQNLQRKLGITINDNDEIIPLLPIGSRKMMTWKAEKSQRMVMRAKYTASTGDSDSAIVYFQKALKLDPSLDLNPKQETEQLEKQAVPYLVMKGDELAKTGELNDAVVIYQKAKKIDPDFNLVPKMRAEELGKQAAPYLIEKGKEIARIGDLDNAIKHFQKALQLDPSLELDPKQEAGKIAAQEYFYKGENLARTGDIEGAIKLFQDALQLNPSLELDPKQEAGKIAASGLLEEGRNLAKTGDIESAIKLFQDALQLDPSLELDPKQEAELSLKRKVTYLLDDGRYLAKTGDIEGAIKLFQDALRLDPSLELDPKQEAGKLTAQKLLEEGRDQAKTGDIEGAIKLFQDALRLDPSLELDPKQEAGKLTAQKLLEEGRDQAKTGDIEGAIKLFQDALQLDPSLELDPKQEARKLEAQGLLEEGRDQVKTGDIEGAIAALTKAQNLDLALIISANYWDNLCWYGSLYGHAEDVMFACEKAVELETSNGLYHQGRGLARSLTGNIEGAIKDFHVYIEWETDEERKSQHQGWVDDLKAGISSKNIFTPEVIEDLKVQ